MSDFAKFGRKEIIWFPEDQIVRWHIDGRGPYETVRVLRTAISRVLVERRGHAEKWVPNLHLSHYEDRSALEREAAEYRWTVPAGQPVWRTS